VAGLNDQWPAIRADMTDLVDRMERNVDSYRGIDALPSFDLFPWFFVVPGFLIALLAGSALLKMRRGGTARRDLMVAAALGLGVTLAPAMFRMIQPGGSMADGPYVPNTDSSCTDPSYTPLLPGTDGGLLLGGTQPSPDPAFDDAGNGLSASVTEPTPFFGVAFAVAIDQEAEPPMLTATAGELSGQFTAWSANYANLAFNQGAPKPDGSMPGLSSLPVGAIDPETGEYSLDWASQIVGGSFNEFTGVWHLEGVFTPAG